MREEGLQRRPGEKRNIPPEALRHMRRALRSLPEKYGLELCMKFGRGRCVAQPGVWHYMSARILWRASQGCDSYRKPRCEPVKSVLREGEKALRADARQKMTGTARRGYSTFAEDWPPR